MPSLAFFKRDFAFHYRALWNYIFDTSAALIASEIASRESYSNPIQSYSLSLKAMPERAEFVSLRNCADSS